MIDQSFVCYVNRKLVIFKWFLSIYFSHIVIAYIERIRILIEERKIKVKMKQIYILFVCIALAALVYAAPQEMPAAAAGAGTPPATGNPPFWSQFPNLPNIQQFLQNFNPQNAFTTVTNVFGNLGQNFQTTAQNLLNPGGTSNDAPAPAAIINEVVQVAEVQKKDSIEKPSSSK